MNIYIKRHISSIYVHSNTPPQPPHARTEGVVVEQHGRGEPLVVDAQGEGLLDEPQEGGAVDLFSWLMVCVCGS